MSNPDQLAAIKQPEVHAVLRLLLSANSPGFQPPDRDRALTFDPLREIAKKWLSASSLTQTERKYLGVFSRLATPSMAVRVLGELLIVGRRLNIFEGMLLCIDELEALFTSGLSAPKVQSFLQDLRYLFDDAVKSGEGYSLLIIAATTGQGLTHLNDFNYPLHQRLGMDGDGRVTLQQIGDMDDARSFAEAYIDYEYERAQGAGLLRQSVTTRQARSLVSSDELRSAYTAAVGTGAPLTRASGRANQAQLLESLHNVVEEKRRSATSS
jgi:hypothetical protein